MDFQLDLNTETVAHAHPTQPLCVAPNTTARRVLELLKDNNRGAAFVCEGETLVGIFTERDALKLMANGGNLDVTIDAIMIKDPVTLSSNATVGQAISKMSFGGYRRLPIVDEANHPVGVVKVSGILHYLVEHFPSVIYNLPPSPHHATQEREGA